MSDKTKNFQEFMKQDFNVVEDYKASKEITPKEALRIINSDWHEVTSEQKSEANEKLDEVITELEEYRKRDTSMKVLKQYWEQEHPDYHYFLEGLRDVVEKIMEDWSDDNNE